MSLVLHLARTDLQRVWPLAVLSVVLSLGGPLLAERTARLPIANDVMPRILPPEFLAWVAALLVSGLLGALVVLADSPLDGQAFWRTRPIRWRQLLAAKLLVLAAILVAVPIVVHAAWLVSYGAPAASVLTASVQLALSRLVWILPAILLAALSGSVARLLVVAIVLVVVLLWGLPMLLVLLLAPGGAGAIGSVSAGFMSFGLNAPTLVGLFLLAAWLAGLIALLYRSRRRGLVAALAAATIVLPIDEAGLAAIRWRDTSPPADLAEGRLGPVILADARLEGAPAADAEKAGERPGGRPAIVGTFTLPALPSQYTANLEPRKTRIAGAGNFPGMPGAGAAMPVAVEQARAAGLDPCSSGARLWFWQSNTQVSCLRQIRSVLVQDEWPRLRELRGRPLDLSGEARVGLARHRAVAVLPLDAGVAFRTSGYLLEVLQARRRPGDLALLLRLTRFPRFGRQLEHLSLFARARDGSRGAALSVGPVRLPESMTMFASYDVHHAWRVGPWGADVQVLALGQVGLGGLPGLDPLASLDWLADAELVLVESTYAGAVEVHWAADHLRLDVAER